MKLRTIGAALPLAIVALAAANTTAGAQTVEGNWSTPTGSVVQVYSCSTAVCLRIVAVEKSAPGTLDANNPDATLRSRSLCGLEIGSGFQPVDGGKSAENGKIYDPASGKTYSGSLAASGPNRLKLRGYVGVKLFGRTEEWTRSAAPVPACK